MKIAVGLQARTQSSRLPGKALAGIGDKALIDWCFDAMLDLPSEWCKHLLTTNLEVDTVLAEKAERRGFQVIRGDEADVLSRYQQLVDQVQPEYVLRLTADNPFVVPEVLAEMVAKAVEHGYPYLSSFFDSNVPYGLGGNVFRADLLKSLRGLDLTAYEKEHVEPAFWSRLGTKRSGFISGFFPQNAGGLRMTVDTPMDLMRARGLARRMELGATSYDFARWYVDRSCVVFAHGNFGKRAVKLLLRKKIKIALLVIQEESDKEWVSEVFQAGSEADQPPTRVLSDIEGAIAKDLRETSALLGLSFWSSHIFTQAEIDSLPFGFFNLHNSVLPDHRGSGANIWAILEDKGAGATLHLVSSALDKGPPIAQACIALTAGETGGSLFHKEIDLMLDLLGGSYEWLFSGIQQDLVLPLTSLEAGCFHSKASRDVSKQLKLDERMRVGDLIKLLRAYSFPPTDGVRYFDSEGNEWSLIVSATLIGRKENA